jgi:hypothetical protein
MDQECIDRCTAMQMSDQCNLFTCGTDKSFKGAESHDESSTTTDQSDGPSPCETDQNGKDKCNSTHLMKASGMCDAVVCDVTAKLCSVDGSKVLPFCESDKLFEKCEAACMTSNELKSGNSPESEGCMLPLSRPCGDGDCDPFAGAPKSAEDIASVKTDMCAIKTTCETCVVDATNSACNDMPESPEKKHETRMAAYAKCIDGMIELLKINHRITIHCKRAIGHTWWVLHHYVRLVTKLTHVVVDFHGMYNDVHVADESPSTMKADACDHYSIQFTVLILSNASRAMGYKLPFVEEVSLHLLVLIFFMYVKYRAAAAATNTTAAGSRYGKQNVYQYNKSKKPWRRNLKRRKRQQGRFGHLPPERRKFIRNPGSLQRRWLRRQQRWNICAVTEKSVKKLLVFRGNVMRKTSNNYYAPYFVETTTTATPKKSNEAMGKKDVGGSNFEVGASTARRSRKKVVIRRAFGVYRFAWFFIGCCLVSVCEVLGLSPVPNGDNSKGKPGNGLRKLVFDYLAGSGTAYNNVVSTYGHIQYWDTSQVTNMRYLFFNMKSGNPDISKWNTGAVTTMKQSKSFTIKCCFFCLCQLMLFACFFVCCC